MFFFFFDDPNGKNEPNRPTTCWCNTNTHTYIRSTAHIWARIQTERGNWNNLVVLLRSSQMKSLFPNFSFPFPFVCVCVRGFFLFSYFLWRSIKLIERVYRFDTNFVVCMTEINLTKEWTDTEFHFVTSVSASARSIWFFLFHANIWLHVHISNAPHRCHPLSIRAHTQSDRMEFIYHKHEQIFDSSLSSVLYRRSGCSQVELISHVSFSIWICVYKQLAKNHDIVSTGVTSK